MQHSLPSDILFHPSAGKMDPILPKKGVLFVNPGEAKKAHQLLLQQGGKRGFLFNSSLTISEDGTFFVAGPCIGAPQAVLVFEKLIVLGALSIVQMGWCGSLDPSYVIGALVIPDGAVSGEGTSKYYVAPGADVPGPSPMLQQALLQAVSAEDYGICGPGRIWSTDAFYRESRGELQNLHEQKQVIGVDMEFSALCAVASFRGIEFAALMVVSDELYRQSWNPGFTTAAFKRRCTDVIHFLVEKGGALV